MTNHSLISYYYINACNELRRGSLVGVGGGYEYFKFTRDNPILNFFTNYIKLVSQNRNFFKTDPHVQCTFFAKWEFCPFSVSGYTHEQINQLASHGDSAHCCQMVLRTWAHSKRKTTLGTLLKALGHIGRYDIVKILQDDLKNTETDLRHVQMV